MGLVFEAPVFFLNLREFAVIFDLDLAVFAKLGPSGLLWLWRMILLHVALCRYNAIVIYAYSVVFYRGELREAMPG